MMLFRKKDSLFDKISHLTIISTLVLGTILVAALGCNTEKKIFTTQVIPDIVDFNLHIKPILSDRCFKCHGPDAVTRKAGLRFDTEEGAFAALGEQGEEKHFAIIAGDTENSTMIQRIYSDDPTKMMPTPESNLKVTEYEKALLKKWVEQGANWKRHWSFLPIEETAVPNVEGVNSENPIDHFVSRKRKNMGLQSVGQAEKEQLIRRVSFSLTGLAPSLEEIDDFLDDNDPDAFEKVVDRLLDSDAYAENMTATWLDLARYADSHGYQDDLERVMFPWRDWVIHAFKKNMPYDEFVTWQLAGDLLPNATKEQIIATGFNRNHKITQEGGVIPEEYRVEYVSDRTQTFATAFLGLTFECAKCHDHKYDAISQKDYFSLFSFFNNVEEKGLIDYGEIPEPYITLTKEEIEETLNFINNIDTIGEIKLMVMQEMDEPRQAHVLARGAYDKPTTPVDPDMPQSILEFTDDYRQDRLGLAEWLFSPKNPLTARVTVNRLWQQCFGQGIVSTPDDFGNQGALPTHPELLDWLAHDLMTNGWDLKKTLRKIVLSATYKQSTKITDELLEIDPNNNYLARAPRLRLRAEMIRDHALTISGLLNRTIGGPSVKPYQPEGLWAEVIGGGGGSLAKYEVDKGAKVYRRSIYTFWKRTVPPPSMMIFDAASRDVCSAKRPSTGTPLQALVMLNDPQIIEASRVMAYNAVKAKETEAERIARMFRLATSRKIDNDELVNLLSYYESEKERFAKEPEAAKSLMSIGNYPHTELIPASEIAAYTMVAGAIFNIDETIIRG